MKRTFIINTLIVTALITLGLASAIPDSPRDRFSQITQLLARELPREHLSRRELNDAISGQTLTNYISSLDFEHAYFLQSDIDTFKRQADSLDNDLQEGINAFAFEVFEIYKERVRDRTAYVDQLLNDGFDMTIEESYHWKRDDAAWPADQDAWDDLWRKRIKNEYLRRLLADEEANATTNDTAFSITNALAQIENQVEQETTTITTTNSNVATNITTNDDDELIYEEPPMTPEEFIRNRYIQYQHVIEDADAEWILQKYLSAFARAFDPHCDYMFPATAEDFEIEMKLSLVGIGAMLRPEDGAAKIVSLIPGGPAAKDKRDNRLRPGDKIIAVAQDKEPPVSILHWPLYKAVRLIRGEVGTRVVLTVIPASDPTGVQTKKVDLIRQKVKLEEREAKSEIETTTNQDGESRKIGIVSLPTFYADLHGKRYSPDYKSASRDVAAILREMRGEEVDGVILDLRGNGGGSLIEAVLMTGLFIESGPVVLVKERRGITILPDNDPTIAYNGPLVVLVNRVSASASEILAAALQDYGRAIIVGDSKTHGKGTVQTVIELGGKSDTGSIKVTNALFYRISGGSTQLRGVTPDIIIPSAFDYMEFGEDYLDNPLEWSTVNPVMFSSYGDLDPIIPELAKRSHDRQSNDERYLAYRSLLERIESMNKRETISLNLAQRREESRTEQELLDIQNKLLDQGQEPDDDEEEEKADLIKEEAMQILADLITLQSETSEQNSEP